MLASTYGDLTRIEMDRPRSDALACPILHVVLRKSPKLSVLITEPCMYCGVMHTHGLGEGHRSQHCGYPPRAGENLPGYVLQLVAGVAFLSPDGQCVAQKRDESRCTRAPALNDSMCALHRDNSRRFSYVDGPSSRDVHFAIRAVAHAETI